ncbi:unnamed protein product [Sphagnum balticum]
MNSGNIFKGTGLGSRQNPIVVGGGNATGNTLFNNQPTQGGIFNAQNKSVGLNNTVNTPNPIGNIFNQQKTGTNNIFSSNSSGQTTGFGVGQNQGQNMPGQSQNMQGQGQNMQMMQGQGFQGQKVQGQGYQGNMGNPIFGVQANNSPQGIIFNNSGVQNVGTGQQSVGWGVQANPTLSNPLQVPNHANPMGNVIPAVNQLSQVPLANPMNALLSLHSLDGSGFYPRSL